MFTFWEVYSVFLLVNHFWRSLILTSGFFVNSEAKYGKIFNHWPGEGGFLLNEENSYFLVESNWSFIFSSIWNC